MPTARIRTQYGMDPATDRQSDDHYRGERQHRDAARWNDARGVWSADAPRPGRPAGRDAE
jgi:hypothetical protein